MIYRMLIVFFFFNDTATTEIYTLSLHDALPISIHNLWPVQMAQGNIIKVGRKLIAANLAQVAYVNFLFTFRSVAPGDRKSTRLNSSHANISYAVFCLKKKKHKHYHSTLHSSIHY